jgi:hypothetical protein
MTTAGGAAVDALHRWFRSHPCTDLDQLCRVLRASGRTVFRVLARAGYLSSFSHAGRYYTLADRPQFDELGLWFCDDVGFSRHGTLRATLKHLVERAPAGHTQEELRSLVRLRVHDTLRDLVEAGELGRRLIETLFVYLSADGARAKVQVAKRKELLAARPSVPATVDAGRVIEVLLAVLRRPGAGAADVAADLRLRGVVVSDEQVAATLAHYAVGKKTTRSRSTRSPR